MIIKGLSFKQIIIKKLDGESPTLIIFETNFCYQKLPINPKDLLVTSYRKRRRECLSLSFLKYVT